MTDSLKETRAILAQQLRAGLVHDLKENSRLEEMCEALEREATEWPWLRLENVPTWRDVCLRTLPVGSCVNALAYAPDGKTLASGSFDETVRLWDTSTGGRVGHIGILGSLAFPFQDSRGLFWMDSGHLAVASIVGSPGSYRPVVEQWQLMGFPSP